MSPHPTSITPKTKLHLVMTESISIQNENETDVLTENETIEHRAKTIFQEDITKHYAFVDLLLIKLLVIEWIIEIAIAFLYSPTTWLGTQSSIHIHIWIACGLGFMIILLPIILALKIPGHYLTRSSIVIAQAITSAILIHLTGGRLETHFHIFASLAIMAFYRDWRVLVLGTLVAAADHVLRGIFWPMSVFGTTQGTDWRWLEHAGWVIFEDVFLVLGCCKSVMEMKILAHRQAQQETVSDYLQNEVRQSSSKVLTTSHELYQTADMMKLATTEMQNLSGQVLPLTGQLNESVASITMSTAQTVQNISTVSELSQELQSDNSKISNTLSDISMKTEDVSEAAHRTVQMISKAAKAIEDINHSISQVATHTRQSTEQATQIEQSIQQTNGSLQELQLAASEIHQVVDLIKGIASQTNLLALNATIEAASAGEAGKGFAVVASEVKHLATQSADSTKSIQDKVHHMQERIDALVSMINGMTNNIGEILGSSSAIAKSIQQQQLSSGEINTLIQDTVADSQSMSGKAKSTAKELNEIALLTKESVHHYQRITSSLLEISQASNGIHSATEQALQQTTSVIQHIEHANQAAEETGVSADKVIQVSQELTTLSEALDTTTKNLRF